MLAHSVMLTDKGGAIVFVWDKECADAASVVEGFERIASDEKGDVFVQYCFLNCENNYFSEKWWNSLPDSQKLLLRTYAPLTYYEGGKFECNEPRLVDWKFA